MPNFTDGKTWVTDEDITAADLNTYLRDNVDHLQDWIGQLADPQTSTADSAGFTTVETTLLTLSVTVPAGGRDAKLTGQGHLETTVAGDVVTVKLKEGATVLREIDVRLGAANTREAFNLWAWLDAPAQGAKTYTLTAVRKSGTGTITAKAASTYPLMLFCEGA